MLSCTFVLSLLFYSCDSSIVFGQVAQQVFVAEEWVYDARNEANAKALYHADVEKLLGALKQEQVELFEKLKEADKARLSAKAGLKTVEKQAEDQCQKLHLIEIDLATQSQLVIHLKFELQKVKEAAQLAKAKKQASYLLSMEETQVRLAEELSKVCKDYCNATWDRALSVVGVPADSIWRQLRSVYYHPDIREVPGAIPSPSVFTPETSKQPLTIQAALSLPEASKGSSQVGDQGQGAEGDKDKGKGKEKKPSSEAKNVAKDQEAAAKAKEAKAKTKEADPKAKDAPTSQPSQKEDPPAPKAKAQHLGFSCRLFFFFWQWHSVTKYNVLLFI